MEKIETIFNKENICLRNLTIEFSKRMQRLRSEYSEDFQICDEDWVKLKEELPFENINYVTTKKVMENLIVSKHLKHRATDKTLYELLENNSSYRFYPKSFYYSKC